MNGEYIKYRVVTFPKDDFQAGSLLSTFWSALQNSDYTQNLKVECQTHFPQCLHVLRSQQMTFHFIHYIDWLSWHFLMLSLVCLPWHTNQLLSFLKKNCWPLFSPTIATFLSNTYYPNVKVCIIALSKISM